MDIERRERDRERETERQKERGGYRKKDREREKDEERKRGRERERERMGVRRRGHEFVSDQNMEACSMESCLWSVSPADRKHMSKHTLHTDTLYIPSDMAYIFIAFFRVFSILFSLLHIINFLMVGHGGGLHFLNIYLFISAFLNAPVRAIANGRPVIVYVCVCVCVCV